jgi:thymidylate synthase
MNRIYNSADEQYLLLAREILNDGYYDQNRTGVATKKLCGRFFRFDLQKEFPILTTKKVFFKTAVKELIWIFVKGSNSVKDLQEMKVSIWDEWERDDGTIGKAYGYQARHWGGEIDQVQKLIDTLKTNPQSRRMMISLWNVTDLPDMALEPCCFLTMWDVMGDTLNMTLVQRSCDMGLGVPFNMTQYAALQCMVAHATGLKPGQFLHVMNNVHIYENHFSAFEEQLSRTPFQSTARIQINPEVTDFNKFTDKDIELLDYKSHPVIPMEVAV